MPIRCLEPTPFRHVPHNYIQQLLCCVVKWPVIPKIFSSPHSPFLSTNYSSFNVFRFSLSFTKAHIGTGVELRLGRHSWASWFNCEGHKSSFRFLHEQYIRLICYHENSIILQHSSTSRLSPTTFLSGLWPVKATRFYNGYSSSIRTPLQEAEFWCTKTFGLAARPLSISGKSWPRSGKLNW